MFLNNSQFLPSLHPSFSVFPLLSYPNFSIQYFLLSSFSIFKKKIHSFYFVLHFHLFSPPSFSQLISPVTYFYLQVRVSHSFHNSSHEPQPTPSDIIIPFSLRHTHTIRKTTTYKHSRCPELTHSQRTKALQAYTHFYKHSPDTCDCVL